MAEGLRGNASGIVMDMGRAELAKEAGIPNLVERIKEYTFPNSRAEAKELFYQGQREGGPLTRERRKYDIIRIAAQTLVDSIAEAG